MYHFYLFETLIPSIYKFGMTSNPVKKRLLQYKGTSKPKTVIGYYECEDGFLMESKFKKFLNMKNIRIALQYGDEYFCFKGGIHILFYEFSKQLNKKVQSISLHRNKKKYNEKEAQKIVRCEIQDMLHLEDEVVDWKILGKDLDKILPKIIENDKKYCKLLKVKPARCRSINYNRAKSLQMLNKYLRACDMNKIIRTKRVRNRKNKIPTDVYDLYEYGLSNKLNLTFNPKV